mmetsp:Transcript_100426/g.309770  ORF Transcript_100426/g.309770 Transcript_100426/m.309770 type:complete len:92 (+) Transcript_100426:86-361(+)
MSASEQAERACFSDSATVALVVDHEAGSLTWLLFPAEGLDPVVFAAALPEPLAGRRLAPVVSGTSNTSAAVRVRLDDPSCPTWRSGEEPLD